MNRHSVHTNGEHLVAARTLHILGWSDRLQISELSNYTLYVDDNFRLLAFSTTHCVRSSHIRSIPTLSLFRCVSPFLVFPKSSSHSTLVLRFCIAIFANNFWYVLHKLFVVSFDALGKTERHFNLKLNTFEPCSETMCMGGKWCENLCDFLLTHNRPPVCPLRSHSIHSSHCNLISFKLLRAVFILKVNGISDVCVCPCCCQDIRT